MAWIHPRFTLGEHQFSVIEVIDSSITPGKDVQSRSLVLIVFAVVIVIVGIVMRREKPQIVPAALARDIPDALDRRLRRHKEIYPLIDVR